MDALLVILAVGVLILIYLLPYYVARTRNHPQLPAMFILNLLLGWTILVWILLLAWAVWNYEKQE